MSRFFCEFINAEGGSPEAGPEYVIWRDKKLRIVEVSSVWWDRGEESRHAPGTCFESCPDEFWWRQRSRHYFEVVLEDGKSYYIYFDGRKDQWVMEQEI